MDSYGRFAEIYDKVMADVPYDDWAARIDRDIRLYGISEKPGNTAGASSDASEDELLKSERDLVCDLACGTGIVTRKLFDMGYDVFGVDISPDMLSVATASDEGRGIMYLNQDISELDLYSTIGTAVCVFDSLNYLLKDEDLEKVFKGVSNFLYPGGLFIFDCNTTYKYRDVMGDTTLASSDDGYSYIWDNYYDSDEKINECELSIFIEREDGLYEKAEETHLQRGIDEEDIKKLAASAGLEIVFTADSDTGSDVSASTERIYACLKKPEK